MGRHEIGRHKTKSNKTKSNNTKSNKTKLQKVLIVLIAVFLVILAGLATIFIREIIISNSGDEQGHGVIGQPENPNVPPGENPDDWPDDWPDDEPEQRPPATPDPDANLDGINPLTGTAMDLRYDRNRPLAIVLNNLPEALPLNGVSSADILYEYPVEGGLTRMLALFQDVFYVEKIGSIRSARHYTVQLANAYDAILVSAGRSPQALTEVNNLGIPFLNEVEGPHREIFFRDRNRIPGRRVENLHSVVTTGARIFQWLPEYTFRITHESGFEPSLFFIEDGTPQGGAIANEIRMRFSSAKSTSFIYDSANKVYKVRQSNVDFVDANDNSPATFSNILFIKTSVTGLQGDDAGRLDIVTTGSGTGYFASGGRYIRINWARTNKSSQFVYTLEDGSPLFLSAGKTYICILPRNLDPTFE